MDLRTVTACCLAIVCLVACDEKPPALSKDGAGVGPGKKIGLAVICSDFQKTARLLTIDLASGKANRAGLPVHSDAVVRPTGSEQKIFVVNRRGMDSLMETDLSAVKPLRDLAIVGWPNLQDAYVQQADVAYLTSYDRNGVRKIDSRDGRLLKDISFADLKDRDGEKADDGDGAPEPTWMWNHGTDLWVQLQRLDKNDPLFAPKGKSMLAIVDLVTDTARELIALARPNPVTEFKVGPDGAVYVGEGGYVGKAAKIDGAIEKFDPQTRQSLGIVVEESTVGGDIVDFEILTATLGVAIVSAPNSKLVTFDPTTGRKIAEFAPATGYDYFQLLLDRGRGVLLLLDRSLTKPAIRVFEAATMEEKVGFGWEFKELPPAHMAFVE